MTIDALAAYEAWQAYWGYPDARVPAIPPLVGSHRAITFPTTTLGTKCRIALNADLSQDWRSWSWLDISDRVRWQDGVTVTTGKRDRDPNVPASTAAFTVENIDGELSRQNVYSTLFGSLFKHNPIWLTTDVGNGEFDEFFGFTQELPKRSDKSGTDGRIHMVCKGPLDHIFRSKERTSPLTLSCGAAAPTHLWTLEEESTATQASSALSDGEPMQQTGTISWASSSTIVGAKSLPNMRSGSGTLVGALDQGIPAGAPGYAFDHNYIVSAVTRPEDFASGSFNVFRVGTENQNTVASWDLNVVNDGTLQLISNNLGGGTTVQATSAVISGIFTEPKLLTFTGELFNDGINGSGSAGDAEFRILVNGVEVATTGTINMYTGNLLTGTLTASSASEAAPVGMFMVHHLDYFEGGQFLQNVDTVPNVAEIVAAMTGHAGEMVHERLRRICRQRNIPFYTSAGMSQRLGPQPIDTPINVIRNAEVVDGVVYEKEFGLAYKSTAEYYRQAVSMALDMAQGHILGELVPADDTTKFYNQWTITRSGGSSSTQQKDGGISANEEVFPNEGTRNVETDVQTAYLASYYANRDSSEADRWPYVKFALQKHPSLIPSYQGMPFGGRVTVANMKTRWGLLSLDLTVEGKTVFFNSKQYEVTVNASDATIHNIGMLDGGQALDSRNLFLNTALDASPRLKDTFTRTSASSWDSPDVGPAYVLSGTGTASVGNGVGTHTLNVAGDFNAALNIVQNNSDFIVDFQCEKLPTGPAGTDVIASIFLRWVDSNNFLEARAFCRPTNDIVFNIRQMVGGVETASSFPVIPGATATTWIRARLYTQDSFFGAKVWLRDSAIESTLWFVALTGVTHLTAGGTQINSHADNTLTNFPAIINWDNVNEPGTMEVISRDEHEHVTMDVSDYPVDITMLGERLTAVSVSEIAFDTFDRTSVDTWSISDSGHSITNLGGAATDYDVNGGTGKHLLTSVNVMRHSVYGLGSGLPADTYKDIEFYADVKISVTPTGGAISCWLTNRFQDVSNYYDVVFLFFDTVTAGITIGLRAGGTHTLLTSQGAGGIIPLGAFTVGNFWRVQMRVMGNTVSGKAWELATQAEPSEYIVSGTASGVVHPLGSDVALQSRCEPGNTNVNPVVEWDNFHVLTPQRLAVVRSINDVVRAHPVGRQVRAYDPFVLGL